MKPAACPVCGGIVCAHPERDVLGIACTCQPRPPAPDHERFVCEVCGLDTASATAFEYHACSKPAPEPEKCSRCLGVHASRKCSDGVHHGSALPFPQVCTAPPTPASERDRAGRAGDDGEKCSHCGMRLDDCTCDWRNAPRPEGAREWWIAIDDQGYTEAWSSKPDDEHHFAERVHVTEYAAYEKLKAERDEMKRLQEIAYGNAISFERKFEDAREERAKLAADVERLKRQLADAIDGHDVRSAVIPEGLGESLDE